MMNSNLYHHGILGMRWGRRNGPPYPLGASDHSASERKAGWRKSLDKSNDRRHTKNKVSNDSEKERSKLSDKQKRAIKIGAAAAATALAAYGTYRLAKSGKLDKYIDTGKAKVDALLSKKKAGNAGDVELGRQKVESLFGKGEKVAQTVSGIKRLAKPESLEDTLKNVNPPGRDGNYRNNCTLCSVTSFLRQQGLDVLAGKTGGQQQSVVNIVEECFKGAKTTTGSAVKFGRSRQDAAEMLLNKYGRNAEGVCSIQWKSKPGGHAFNWKIKDGIVSFFDGQSGVGDSIVSGYWNDINPNGGLELARLDGAEINFDGIKKWLECR